MKVGGKRESRLAPIRRLRVDSIRPSPENEQVYRVVRYDDPEVIELAESIRQHGLQEPLIVTRDYYIVSGHQRRWAALLAGLKTVPCLVLPFRREDDLSRFTKLLRECNRQRIKTHAELLREAVLDVNPREAHQRLSEYRQREKQGQTPRNCIAVQGTKRRAKISDAKGPMLAAVKGLIERHQNLWPLSVRMLHYMLLNDPPLKHAGKPGSTYGNDQPSYKNLVELLTRARLRGLIPWEAISDETRPMVVWPTCPSVQPYIRETLDGLFRTYWRDLQQSQPQHVEIVGEKNTLHGVIELVAREFCIPYTLGRGYCSLDPRHEMVERYWRSGKQKLVVLMIADFDPEGEDICHSFLRSLRDDFGVRTVTAAKVALTAEQVKQYQLPARMTAKASSSRYGAFVEQHGEEVWEVEGLPPETLQEILTRAVEGVLDLDAYNAEVTAEEADAGFLEAQRGAVLKSLGDFGGENRP